MRVLIVEDEEKLAGLIRRGLRERGVAVDVASNGEDALWMAGSTPYDAIVLDLMLPGIDGLEVCRRLRADGVWSPILMLTARDAIDDRVAGLDAGADDYLVKPFALRELIARLRALLRRAEPLANPRLEFAGLTLDQVTREVFRGGRPIELSRTEFSLLELFLEHPRQVLTRSTIFERVWGYDFGATSNALGVYVGYLRRKTERDGA
ncbi:MAG: response regulator, partial [Solirubrobacterales bacterium]|nr:response regulator [Solirubrobacterales bacterium]